MPTLPRKMSGQGRSGAEWNKMVDYLRSITPRQGDGSLLKHTPHGVAYALSPGKRQPPQVFINCTQSVVVWGTAPFSAQSVGDIVENNIDVNMTPPIHASPFTSSAWSRGGGTTNDCSSSTRYATITVVETREAYGREIDGDENVVWAEVSNVTTKTEVSTVSTLDGLVVLHSIVYSGGGSGSYLFERDAYGATTETGSNPGWHWTWGSGTPTEITPAAGAPTSYTNTRNSDVSAEGTGDYDNTWETLTCTKAVTLSNAWTLASAEAACDGMMNLLDLTGNDGSLMNTGGGASFAVGQTVTTNVTLRSQMNYEGAPPHHTFVGYWVRTTSHGLILIFGLYTILKNATGLAVGGKLRQTLNVYNNGVARLVKGKGRFWTVTDFAPKGYWCMNHYAEPTGYCGGGAAVGTSSYTYHGPGRNYFDPDNDLVYDPGTAAVTVCEIQYSGGTCQAAANACGALCSAPP